MHRPFALVVFITVACGVLAQEPTADDARVAEAIGMVEADCYYDYYDALAILERTGGPDEARALAKQYVSTNPDHASGHLLVGRIFETQGFRVPALFTYMRFLALEPSSPRSAEVATRLQNLMIITGMRKTMEGRVKVTPPQSRKEEGDFARMEFNLWFVSERISRGLLLDTKGASEFAKAVYALSEVIQSDVMDQRSKEARNAPPNFTTTVQRPFFSALEKRNLVGAYAGLALSALNLTGTEAWMQKNARQVDRYRSWLQSQAAKPKAAQRRK